MEQECKYNKSPFLYEKQFNLFRYKRFFFIVVRVDDHAIEVGSDFTIIKNNKRFELYFSLSFFRRVFIINIHDKRVGYKPEEIMT
jgi:hypothetical protein